MSQQGRAFNLANNFAKSERQAWPGMQPFPGGGIPRVAVACFNPSANTGERTVAAHGLNVRIPLNAHITRAWYRVVTTCHSPSTGAGVDKATLALSVEGANDIKTATAIEAGGNVWDAAVPVACNPTNPIAVTTSDKEVTMTVGVDPLDAGKLFVFVEYILAPAA